ncbi:MAG: ethanolamine ammonia-lyase subunit EutB, partial [Planctomycetales bacterium]|nr:ethanolamine ammonia-lyase subunit EutB [Planctomycetales bacterium]
MADRRTFVKKLAVGATGLAVGFDHRTNVAAAESQVKSIRVPQAGESVFDYVKQVSDKQFDLDTYCQVLGAANEFKEGDEIVGVAAADENSRRNARTLLSNTRLVDIDAHPPHTDELFRFANQARSKTKQTADWTFADLKEFLLTKSESKIKEVASSLSSDVIGCIVKLMTNQELTVVGAEIFNPLPGTQLGAKGYLGARVQPNSPTDHPDDIRWQVFDAFSYAVGDVLLGTNPVSSDPASVAEVELTLKEVLDVFQISDLMPHCVLSHIDVQAEVERANPGSTELWFQSIGGTDKANGTFDLSIEKMKRYASQRTGRYGLYFETGQGADFTNGHDHGFDMVLHESRKYGFARALTQLVSKTTGQPAWVHLNDVAGFIGPEVFRSREQLVRCCLEDIVMGKLHGLCIGLDVCSTLHM